MRIFLVFSTSSLWTSYLSKNSINFYFSSSLIYSFGFLIQSSISSTWPIIFCFYSSIELFIICFKALKFVSSLRISLSLISSCSFKKVSSCLFFSEMNFSKEISSLARENTFLISSTNSYLY